MSFILIVMNFLVIPFEIAFEIDENDILLRYLNGFTYLLIIDICFKFKAQYYEFGCLVSQSRKIFTHYLYTTFIFDVVALGFVLFSSNILWKLVFFLKFFDLVKIMQKYADLLFFSEFYWKISKLLMFFIKLSILANFLACFWYLLAQTSSDASTWLTTAKIHANPHNNFNLYLMSFYWIITFLSSKPDYERFGPANNSEYLFCVFLQIFSLFFLFYAFIDLKCLFSSQNKEKTLRCLRKIGKFQGVSVLGNDKIMKSIRYFDENMIENEIFLKLNSQFRQKFIAQEFFQILNSNAFFKANFQINFLKKLAETVTIVQFWPGEKIFSVFCNFPIFFLFFQNF